MLVHVATDQSYNCMTLNFDKLWSGTFMFFPIFGAPKRPWRPSLSHIEEGSIESVNVKSIHWQPPVVHCFRNQNNNNFMFWNCYFWVWHRLWCWWYENVYEMTTITVHCTGYFYICGKLSKPHLLLLKRLKSH